MSALYGLIGYPLSHSFSKRYFSEKFIKEGISGCEYNLYPLEDVNQLPQLIAEQTGLLGLNVTIPYKESVIPFLDELDETAKAVGAVNCIKIIRSGSHISHLISHISKGHNTDIIGFRQSIKPFLEIQHERALILGTGGASKAVAYVLKEIGIDCYFVTGDKQNARVSQSYSNRLFTYDELNEYIINAFKLIVNTTPVGMYPNISDCPSLPYQFLQSSHLLYDLVYNPTETEFLKQGKSKGTATVNGLSMLHLQAEEAWRIWNS